MIYFSELKGKPVVTEDQVRVGQLTDLAFLVSDSPKITKLIIKDKNNTLLKVSTSVIRNINHTIVITKQFENQELNEQELYLEKNLLDKQIIDIGGNKVVRVNDIAINDKAGYYIGGVDIGILGILRWLKIEDVMLKFLTPFGIKISSKFLSWGDIQPLELARGMVILKTEEDKLKKIRPEDLADYLEKINIVNVDRILKALDDEFAAEIINNLNINYQTVLFRRFIPEKAAHIIGLVDPDEAVDILLTLTEKKREEIIELLRPQKQREIHHLLKLARTAIGEKLTTEYLTVSPDNTVREVIDKIRKESAAFSLLNYIYVLNKEEKLIGVFGLHELLMQNLDAVVYKFMIPNVVVIHLTTPEEIAIAKMMKYKLHALPVIDGEQHILGIVAIDDLSDVILEKMK
ncbi:magnesium transporter [Candidatus Roizmanbacteria bacterium]|nr:magnesium transporter [Candidatus Roizmanbacteria bacterium]